jgi:hypothetical protein
MHILRLAALPLALGLSLSACLDPDTITSSNPTATAALAGGVAFHLSGSDSLALVGKADSVRIEASRTGYPTHSVSGSLQGTTRLSDLEPGLWNLKIALYDASLAVRWAGDTTVNIFSGTTADAVVRLHPATGSVNVRIVLDTTILPMPDSSFTSYSYSISSMSGSLGTYTLEANGKATFTPPYQIVLVDSTGITPMTPKILSGSATMHPDSLAIALSILQSNAVRHPVSLAEQQPLVSNGIEISCPTDAPYYSRKISYANGASANLSWSYSNFCGTLPIGWQNLNRVDNMLERLLPRVITYLDVDGSPLIAN